MIFCSKCKKVIKDQEGCYQIRYGHWAKQGAQAPGEFEAEEDIAYYHEECFPLKVG